MYCPACTIQMQREFTTHRIQYTCPHCYHIIFIENREYEITKFIQFMLKQITVHKNTSINVGAK